MSLRGIRRQREGGSNGTHLRFGNNRFAKLSMGKKGPTKLRKDLLLILIIAVVAIAIIAIELSIWGGQKAADEPTVNDTNETPDGQPLELEQPPEEAKPDLDIRSFDVGTKSVFAGDTLTIAATVKNKGDANATDVTIALFVGDTRVDAKVVSIAADETMDLTFEWTPMEAQIGKQAVRLVVDPDNIIDEENEENNQEGEEIEVKEQLIEDVSEDFELQSTAQFNIHWYSDKFKVPPQGGEDYTYFQLTREDTSLYYLDLVVSGFRATNNNNILGIEIPDASESEWNGRKCIKRDMESDTCIWNGPQIKIALEIDGSRLVATDQDGQEDKVTTSGDDVDSISLTGMRTARWPGEIKTWKGFDAPSPDYFVPLEFYEVVGNDIYIHPMKWNPKALRAEVALWFRFEITTD